MLVTIENLTFKGVTELARSIKTEGLQNPPMVQKEGKEYLLMSGQRRLAALKRLKAKKIPALVLTKNAKYELDDAKAASVVENLHRKDMETREMALACAFLADKKGKSKAAQSLGISKIMFKKYHGFAGAMSLPDPFARLFVSRIGSFSAVSTLLRALVLFCATFFLLYQEFLCTVCVQKHLLYLKLSLPPGWLF